MARVKLTGVERGCRLNDTLRAPASPVRRSTQNELHETSCMMRSAAMGGDALICCALEWRQKPRLQVRFARQRCASTGSQAGRSQGRSMRAWNPASFATSKNQRQLPGHELRLGTEACADRGRAMIACCNEPQSTFALSVHCRSRADNRRLLAPRRRSLVWQAAPRETRRMR